MRLIPLLVVAAVVLLAMLSARLTRAQDPATAPGSAAAAPSSAPSAQSAPFTVNIRVRADQTAGPLKPIWRFFGADEPNYAYMKDGKKLIGELGKLKKDQVYFRTHNLLCTGDGTPALKWGSTNAYTEDAQGNPVYDWTIVDKIFDSYRAQGVRPMAQLGFMPKALSTHPEPYQHSWTPKSKYQEIMTGWCYPPKDYDKWRELCFQWVKHSIERYGKEEVEQWYWQVWNEPNGAYWKGTQEEWFKTHDYAVDGVRRALPNARIGGPHVAGAAGKYMREYFEHCLRGTNLATGQKGTPLDYLSFQPKGQPKFVEGHVRMGIADHLRVINSAFGTIASFPELKPKPIILGESDPDGCAACQGPQLGYRNGTMYSSYTAASFARKHELADRHGVNLEGALTWAFTFEDQPYFAGFRQLASNGVDLPVMNVFRMFAQMSGDRLESTSDSAVTLDDMLKNGVRGERPDVAAFASREGGKVCAMVWHYHDDDLPGAAADTRVTLTGLPATATKARVREYRIDQEHGNAYTAWQRMGSPQKPTTEQYAELEKAGQLTPAGEPREVEVKSGEAELRVNLPRQAVSLLVVEWAAPASN
ncbi:MAG TPA: hypothetical protein VER17_16725 [Tepidisphaeraceae bacterium]|nr:hypothetical protein [Tepidisphaeraceae bacterium]